MTESLDNILSGSGEAVTEQTPVVEEHVAQVAEGEGQQQQIEPTEQGEQSQGQKMVPHEALHAEKQKVKRYTEEVSDFRKSNEALQRQVAELLQRVPVPKQEQPQAPDQFEDFQGAARHAVSSDLERVNSTLMANAQLIAGIKYGDDKVAEAEQAFLEAVRSQKLDPADFHKVTGSPNRYAAAVQWHQRQIAQSEIGDDPVAFKAKVEAELREKITAELQQGDGQQTQQRQVTMPSNFASARNVANRSAGPAWSGPASIQDIFKR
jgi:hypothetical protein